MSPGWSVLTLPLTVGGAALEPRGWPTSESQSSAARAARRDSFLQPTAAPLHGTAGRDLVWFLHGFVVVDGQKAPLQRQRLRGKNSGEVRLGTYELFQQTRHLDDQVWWKMLRGLTTRNYPLVTRSFAEAYGIEKSAISQRFIQASREKLKTLMERPLGELKLCAIVLDGTPFKGR